MGHNTAQLGFARLGLISFGQYGRDDTDASAIANSSAKAISTYFISVWEEIGSIPEVNPLFVLMSRIDECLYDLENRIPESVVSGSTEIESEVSTNKINCKLDKVNCKLDRLRKKKAEYNL